MWEYGMRLSRKDERQMRLKSGTKKNHAHKCLWKPTYNLVRSTRKPQTFVVVCRIRWLKSIHNVCESPYSDSYIYAYTFDIQRKQQHQQQMNS